jgi:hypothetical protein
MSEGSGETWRAQYVDVVEQAGDVLGSAGARIGGFLRRNPIVGAAVAAVLVGALVGWLVAGRGRHQRLRERQEWLERRRKASAHRVRAASKSTAAAIGPLVVHVLRNPFLRGMLIRAAMRSLRKARRR